MTDDYMTRDQAVAFYESKAWEPMTWRQRAEFQFIVDRLCMPFDVFHKALEITLDRPVYTHELGLNRDGLRAELFDGAPPPSLAEIIDMIPQDKRIVIFAHNEDDPDEIDASRA